MLYQYPLSIPIYSYSLVSIIWMKLFVYFQQLFLKSGSTRFNHECYEIVFTLQVLACVPDLISMVETDTGEPIPTEEVRYGLRVSVLGIPVSPMLRTPQALAVVGPQAFGYPEDEVQFTPIGDYISHNPVPPV